VATAVQYILVVTVSVCKRLRFCAVEVAYNLPPGHIAKGQGCIINSGTFSEYNKPQKFCLLVSSPVFKFGTQRS